MCLCFTEELSGIFVRSISEGSAAALDGRIQVNDQIIEVSKQLERFEDICRKERIQ